MPEKSTLSIKKVTFVSLDEIQDSQSREAEGKDCTAPIGVDHRGTGEPFNCNSYTGCT